MSGRKNGHRNGHRNGHIEDATPLLHNMSVPSKTTVSYAGLGAALDPSGTPSRRRGAPAPLSGVHGVAVRFCLPPDLDPNDPRWQDASLIQRINDRADGLPLPAGCVVVPNTGEADEPWPDELSALAVLSKCSGTVWLRAKTPSVSAALARRQVTLLVPPAFAKAIEAAVSAQEPIPGLDLSDPAMPPAAPTPTPRKTPARKPKASTQESP